MTKTALLKQMEELIEEPGLTCCICREGYKFQVGCVPGWGKGRVCLVAFLSAEKVERCPQASRAALSRA